MNTNLLAQANELIAAGNNLLNLSTNLSAGGLDNKAAGAGLSAISSNITTLGQKISAAATNASSSGSLCSDTCQYVWITILAMIFAVFLGSAGIWAYQRSLPDAEKPDKNDFWKLVFMAACAVALVPLLLRMSSSTLFSTMKTSIEDCFIFIGFCVAAAFAARRFLGTIPQKILDSIGDAKATARAADAKANGAEAKANGAEAKAVAAEKKAATADAKAKEVGEKNENATKKTLELMVNRTGRDVARPARVMEAGVPQLTEDPVLVLRALGDPEFTDYRWVVGLALDTGLSIAPVRRALAELQESGDVRPSIEGQQDHWSLTDQGRETLADIPDEFAQLTVAHTGIQ